MSQNTSAHTMNHYSGLSDDGDVHESARIQVDYLSHKWQEADVWHTWKNMTRQKNDIANGARLENASWRTWWQKRLKLKTVNPQKLNWMKDSDVTWLYGPLHQAPIPKLPPKGASLQDKLNTIPPLPKGRKPILKKRTLAEVLVLGLAKTNTLPNRPPADEMKELDIDTRSTKGPEERDRIMLLHTKSDTNLLLPAMGRVTHPSSPSAEYDRELNANPGRRPAWRTEKSSWSTKASPSPPPHDENGTRKRVGFNAYVSQCIAIAPGERSSSEADSDEDGISMKSAGSASHGSHRHSLSRSNSHSSQRSEPLIIARMAPTLLKENIGDEEEEPRPALVYMPIETPFDGKDSDDELDFDDSKPPAVVQSSGSDSNDGVPDLGADVTMNSKKRRLSAGETPPARRHHKTPENESSTSTLDNTNESSSTVPSISLPNPSSRDIPGSNNIPADEEPRGRTLHRTSSSSSLNERSRSRNGNSPIGSHSPSSSHAPSSAYGRGSSTENGVQSRVTLGITRPEQTAEAPNGMSTNIAGDATDIVEQASEGSEGSSSKLSPKPETTGFVDKAVANARGLIETFLSSPASSLSSKRA